MNRRPRLLLWDS